MILRSSTSTKSNIRPSIQKQKDTVQQKNAKRTILPSVGKKLGCGEQGCTYELENEPELVLKISKFANSKNRLSWQTECNYGVIIGELNLGPKIDRFFISNNTGYIIMQRIKMTNVRETKKQPNGDILNTDHVQRMSVSMQLRFAKILWKLVDTGFLHMDNHWGNLGVTLAGKPITFDFGFVQKRSNMSLRDKMAAFAFSMWQLLEHVPLKDVSKNAFFRLATSAMCGDLNPAHLDQETGLSMAQLALKFPFTDDTFSQKNQRTRLKTQAFKEANDPANADIYFGCFCYATIIQLPQMKRYDQEVYIDPIYDIRRGTFKL